MQIKVVKKNLMNEFQEKFDILFMDYDFGFRADDKLITRIIASLQYEHVQRPGESLIPLNQISDGIFLI